MAIGNISSLPASFSVLQFVTRPWQSPGPPWRSSGAGPPWWTSHRPAPAGCCRQGWAIWPPPGDGSQAPGGQNRIKITKPLHSGINSYTQSSM